MGLIIDSPQPLRNCPTLSVWRKRSGEIYLFFVDETYMQFFELNSRGYFCHGGVGIPENDYEAIKTELAPVFGRYRELLVPELKEFKHREFKRIVFAARWDTKGRLLDVNVTSSSENEIGIQLADLIAGEARAFLEANRDLLEHGASPKLITPDSDEPVQAYGIFFDKPFKTGA